MIRAHLHFNSERDVVKFVSLLNSDKSIDKYSIQNANGDIRTDARSFLGVLYMSFDNYEECYLVNETNDGHFPSGIDQFRA